jgi:hypothetical protein
MVAAAVFSSAASVVSAVGVSSGSAWGEIDGSEPQLMTIGLARAIPSAKINQWRRIASLLGISFANDVDAESKVAQTTSILICGFAMATTALVTEGVDHIQQPGFHGSAPALQRMVGFYLGSTLIAIDGIQFGNGFNQAVHVPRFH